MNSASYHSSIVINELMYQPISGDSDDEYLEPFNSGEEAADLSGWAITEGIRFVFPVGTRIEPGEMLVVARNKTHLLEKYPHLNAQNTVGNYEGSLANSGELI